MCGAAMFLHAIDAVRGRSVADCYLVKLRAILAVIDNLEGTAGAFQEMKAPVSAQLYALVLPQGPKKYDRQALERAPYEWLSQQKRCFVVQFVVMKELDHAVCADGRRRLLWGNEEEYSIELHEYSLRICCGVRPRWVRVRAMKMVPQLEEKNTEKKRVAVIELN